MKALEGLSGYAQQLVGTGRIRIGVKFDTPGLSNIGAGETVPSGFEVEVGKILAGGLGIAPENIQWIQVLGAGREQAVSTNAVDLMVSSYTMSREHSKKIGMAGPYLITGAQWLVRSADKATVSGWTFAVSGNPRLRKIVLPAGQNVCSVSGSPITSALVNEYKLKPVVKATYADCVAQLQTGSVVAVAGDGAIAMGYAHASGGSMAVTGDPFTEEKYGVGFAPAMAGMCDYVQRTLIRAYGDGSWMSAFADTLGDSGVETPPEPPALESC